MCHKTEASSSQKKWIKERVKKDRKGERKRKGEKDGEAGRQKTKEGKRKIK